MHLKIPPSDGCWCEMNALCVCACVRRQASPIERTGLISILINEAREGRCTVALPILPLLAHIGEAGLTKDTLSWLRGTALPAMHTLIYIQNSTFQVLKIPINVGSRYSVQLGTGGYWASKPKGAGQSLLNHCQTAAHEENICNWTHWSIITDYFSS